MSIAIVRTGAINDATGEINEGEKGVSQISGLFVHKNLKNLKPKNFLLKNLRFSSPAGLLSRDPTTCRPHYL